ncbi:MAG: hypothetical protein HKM95_04660 [Inquilinus sp.]|nr:hypothetical protein [Inquilinus sp.]
MVWLIGYVAFLMSIPASVGVFVGMREKRRRQAALRVATVKAMQATQWKGLARDGVAVKVAEIFTRAGMVLVARDGPALTFSWPTRPWLTAFLVIVTAPIGPVYYLAAWLSGVRTRPVTFDISNGEVRAGGTSSAEQRRAA